MVEEVAGGEVEEEVAEVAEVAEVGRDRTQSFRSRSQGWSREEEQQR